MPLSDTERRILYSLGQQRLLEARGKQLLRDAYMRQTLDPRAVGEAPGSDQPSAFQKHRDLLEHGGFNANALHSIQSDMERQQAEADSNTTEQLDPIRAPMPLAIGGALRIARQYGKKYADGGEVNSETGLPDPDEQPSGVFEDPAAMAVLASKKHYEQPTPTVMQPDLQATQTGQQDVPEGYAVNDAGQIFHKQTGEVLPPTPRPSVLPITRNQHGEIEAAMPKVADIIGNMGAGWNVPIAGAEKVLGAGLAMPKKVAVPPKAGEVGRSWFDLPPHEVNGALDVTESKGTSPGAVMTGFSDGQDRYVKQAKSLDHAKNEVLASKLYELAGVPVAKNELTQLHGKPAVASHMVEGEQLSKFGPWQYKDINGLEEHMPADAWLANGDVIGAGVENPKGNIMVKYGTPATGKHEATRIDFGGALRYSGLGGLKSEKLFGPKVGNFLEGLTSEHINPTAAEAFHGHQIDPRNQTAQRIAGITDDQIKGLVYQYGPTDMGAKEKLANTLIARRDDLAKEYGIVKDNVITPDFGHGVPPDDFKESMDALGQLAKTAQLKPMQLNKLHPPEQYISALSGQSYLGALTNKQVTTKQGNKILENFQKMDQDKLALALKGLAPEKMANVATWAQPGTIKKIWAAQKEKTPLAEVFGVEPQEIADEILKKAQHPTGIADQLYAVAKKNPELADEVNKLLPAKTAEDVGNHMNFLIGEHGDPWAEPKFKSGKNYTSDDVEEYWDSVDKKVKDDWELAQGGTDFIKKIDKVWTSKFDKYFKPMTTDEWLAYRPKESTKPIYQENPPLQFPNKTPEQLRKMGVNPDVPIYKGGYKTGKYPEYMGDPSLKHNEPAWFAGALHFIGESYGGEGHVNPYVYGGKDLKIARINFKEAHGGDPSYGSGDMNGLIHAARERGFDALIIEDTHDVGSHTAGLHTQFAFLNTKGLRAPHAEFDPDKLKLNHPNPLWGLVGGGLFTYGMLRGQEGTEQKFAKGGRILASNIESNPSEGQKEAGNYAKDHVHIQGLPITIENAQGSFRRGVDKGGKEWKVRMPHHYGYIKGTVGKDKDHVDVYVGPNRASQNVFVIDQKNAETGKFDEHKAFVGFGTEQQCVECYHKSFSDGRAGERLGHIKKMTVDHFKAWLDGDTTKPVQHSAKVAKAVVNYSKGMPKSHCGICRFYHDRSCTKVQGRIDPAYWCRLFERADHAS